MIGTRAFLLNLGFPLVWLLMLSAIAAIIVRKTRPRIEAKQVGTNKERIRGAAVICLIVLGTAHSLFWITRHFQYRSALRQITAASVDLVQVGGVTVQKPTDVESVIGALRDCDWYMPTAGDGGRARPINVVIRFKSGGEQHYRVARMLKRNGAAIEFTSRNSKSGFIADYGYVFSDTLPQVLDRVGAGLPTGKEDEIPQ
jgi:hypothetical protein